MFQALEGLQDALDGDLDAEEASRVEAQLGVAVQSDRDEIVTLAQAIHGYMQEGRRHWSAAAPGRWERFVLRVQALGLRFGRQRHRTVISVLLILWVVLVVGYIAILIQGGANLDSQVLRWRTPLIGIQAAVGGLMILAILTWLAGNEHRGLRFGVLGFLLSLVGLQTFYFYLSQFYAITSTLLQLACLQVLLAYRRWYLNG